MSVPPAVGEEAVGTPAEVVPSHTPLPRHPRRLRWSRWDWDQWDHAAGVELALLDHFQLDLSQMESEAKELAQVG